MSEAEPESPGDSGTDLRHDSGELRSKDTSDDPSDGETECEAGNKMQVGTIGIRSDLLPLHPLPKEGLKDLSGLHGLPALEALRRQAGQAPFLPGMQSRPSQPPTPQSTGSNDIGGSWTFEEQFKQVNVNCIFRPEYQKSLSVSY